MNVLNITLFVIAVASLQRVTSADGCPSSWIPWGQHCYKFELTFEAPWELAEQRCSRLGSAGRQSHLASIHSQEEQNFIFETFRRAERASGKTYDQWWRPVLSIGLRVLTRADDLRWSDGSPVDYLNWYQGEPNNFQNSIAQISAGESVNGRWVDEGSPGIYPNNYVCKMPQN